MHPPRFAHPRFSLPPPIINPEMLTQRRPHVPTFPPSWHHQRRIRPTNYNSKGFNNFQSHNEEHWCETCDRGFANVQLLENHKKQHQKCNIDGCKFIAHPKVITKHIQMQHSTGIYKKISKLNNPEEIKKWIEERKNKYPTKQNIEKKSAEIKEKVERGEKMGMKYSRENRLSKKEYNMKIKFDQSNHRKNFKRNFHQNKFSSEPKKRKLPEETKKPNHPQSDNISINPMDDTKLLKPFTGILHLIDDTETEDSEEQIHNNYIIEDDEYIGTESNQINSSVNPEPVVCEALSSLICSYESSDTESIHETEIKHNKDTSNKQCNPPSHHNISLNSIDNDSNNLVKSDDDSGPEETQIVKGPELDNKTNDIKPGLHCKKHKQIDANSKMGNRLRNITVNKRNNVVKLRSKLPSTLLEKLLRNEIRQERNIVLQCIRHIVKNNFFDKTKESTLQ